MDNLTNTLCLYIVPLILTLIACIGEEDEAVVWVILLSPVPGINLLLSLMFFERLIRSKFKCILRHHYEEEPNKYKHIMHCSVGGFIEYKCQRCQNKTTVKWSAF
jgi:hypothetical protein